MSSPVNDSPWLTHELVSGAIACDTTGDRMVRYAAEARRVGANTLADDLERWAEQRREPTDAEAAEFERTHRPQLWVLIVRWSEPEDGCVIFGPFDSQADAEENIAAVAEQFAHDIDAPTHDEDSGELIRNVFDRLPEDIEFDADEVNPVQVPR